MELPNDPLARARALGDDIAATSNAIQGSIEVADWTYKRAGEDSIFPGGLFERRFRDMHTLSQQMQARDAHFEAAGQVMLGRPPAVFF